MKKMFLPAVVIGLGIAVSVASLIVLSGNEYLPCSQMKIDKKEWKYYSDREQKCLQERLAAEQKLEADKVQGSVKKWPEYRNDKLGISFKHPPTVDGVPLVFIQAGNLLFVRTASSSLYLRRDELPRQDDNAIFKKADEIEKDVSFGTRSWAIWVRDAKNDFDLQNMIDIRLAPNEDKGCIVAEKKFIPENNDYRIGIDARVPSLDPSDEPFGSSCPINWRLVFLYSEEFKRAAYWDIGQDSKFNVGNCVYGCDADTYMAESFTFIPRSQ